MTQVSAAVGARHFRPYHSHTFIFRGFHISFRDHIPKTRPAGAAFKLCVTGKQRLAADDAHIHAGLMIIYVFPAKWRLGTLEKTDSILLGREFLFGFGRIKRWHTFLIGA